MDRYQRALEEYDIPYTVVSGVEFYDTPELPSLTNLPRVLGGPQDDVYGVLRSPLFGFTDDRLAPAFDDADRWRNWLQPALLEGTLVDEAVRDGQAPEMDGASYTVRNTVRKPPRPVDWHTDDDAVDSAPEISIPPPPSLAPAKRIAATTLVNAVAAASTDVSLGETYRIAVFDAPTSAQDGHESASANRAQPDRQRESPEPPVEEGEAREVTIETVGDQGDGIAKVDRGYVVIVPDTQPGQQPIVEIDQVQQNVAFASVVASDRSYLWPCIGPKKGLSRISEKLGL